MEIDQERIDKAKSDDLPVTERVKTFEDAVRELGENHPFVNIYDTVVNEYPGAGKDIVAYLKLRIIAAALNEGWKPKFGPGECRWAPYFIFADGGLSFTRAVSVSEYTYPSPWTRFFFKTEDLAIHAVLMFRELYRDFLIQP